VKKHSANPIKIISILAAAALLLVFFIRVGLYFFHSKESRNSPIPSPETNKFNIVTPYLFEGVKNAEMARRFAIGPGYWH